MKSIAICGTHGVGKSTLCKAICTHLQSQGKNAILIDEVVRKCPYPINAGMCLEAAEWIIHTQMSLELAAKAEKPDYLICDRSFFDPIFYLAAIEDLSSPDRKYWHLEFYTMDELRKYDAIVVIAPDNERPIEGDGFRATDKDFQLRVHKKVLEKLGRTSRISNPQKVHGFSQKEVFENQDESIKKILDLVSEGKKETLCTQTQ